MKRSNGAILWEGASRLDGAPVVVIATGINKKSGNRKTGAMVQTWILRADVAPNVAVATGQDASVCGDCPHRRGQGGACYVLPFQAPLQIWRAYKRGSYPRRTPDVLAGRMVRLGAYGDPAAAPAGLWRAVASVAAGHTGYTHQWRRSGVALQGLVMASVDSLTERNQASRAGYRTFRVRGPLEPVYQGETTCPASSEAGKRSTCAKCKLCDGSTGPHDRRRSIVIRAHGNKAGKLRVIQ